MRTSTHPPAFWLFPIGLLIALGLSALPGLWPLYTVLGVSTAVLGLPHGSLDTLVGRRYLALDTRLRQAGFFAGYILISALVIGFWWQWPNTALGVFLAYSALHFGDDVAVRIGQWGGLGYGLWVLSLPVAFQPEAVIPLFAALGSDQAATIAAAAPFSLVMGAGLLGIALIQHPQRALSDWRDPLLLALGAWALHPLAYFIAYWCFLHSPRHLLIAAHDLGLHDWRAQLRAVLPTTLAAYALVLVALPLVWQQSADTALLRIIFIGLAALTVPHMLLEWRASRARMLPPTPHQRPAPR